MKNEILVIGHTGFIGKAITEYLISKRIYFQGLSTKECDLKKNKSVNILLKLFKKNTILIITASINREFGDNLINMQQHINMISNIAQALENFPVKKCIYLSSTDVYGYPIRHPITEQTHLNPQTYYATAKLVSEKILSFVAKDRFPLLIFRYNGIFGPGQKRSGYGPNAFIKSIIKDHIVTLWGDGEELRDNVYVKDLAKIIIDLSLSETSGTINVATGNSRSYNEVLNKLRSIGVEKFRIYNKKRTFQSFNQKFNIKILNKHLSRFEFTSFEVALKETYNSYKSFI